MADLSITPAQVIKGSNAVVKSGIAGENITAGEPLYIDTDNANVLKLAGSNGTALIGTVAGIALHGADTSQPIDYQSAGSITLGDGAAMTVGEIYLASNTLGGIAPEADVSTSLDYVSMLGVATTTAVLSLKVFNSGAQIP